MLWGPAREPTQAVAFSGALMASDSEAVIEGGETGQKRQPGKREGCEQEGVCVLLCLCQVLTPALSLNF